MCRKFFLTLILFTAVFASSALNARVRTELIDIYQKDYYMINRTVLVFNRRPNFVIEQNVYDREIKISVEQTDRNQNVPLNRTYVSPVLETIGITGSDGDRLIITINTKQPYYLEHFTLSGIEYKVVFDIYNKQIPTNDQERYAFGKFYFAVSKFAQAETMLSQVLEDSPSITGANYYLGHILLNRSEKEKAIERFRRVDFTDSEYFRAQMELVRLGVVSLEHSNEMEQAFADYRDSFLMAGDVNRQQLLLAFTMAFFGRAEEIRGLLKEIDYNDNDLQRMLQVYHKTLQNLAEDEDLARRIPMLVNLTSDSSPTAANKFLSFFLTALVIAFLSIFITNRYWQKKLAGNIAADSESFTVTDENSDVSAKEQEELTEQTEEEKVSESVSDQNPETVSDNTLKAEKAEINKEPSKIECDDLRTKLILRLHQDGWNHQAIAKELSVEFDEVKQIVEENE